MNEREILIDVSRLVWRLWRGGLPTGIDRVCLAYVDHFRSRAQAVVQRGGRYYIFTPGHSDKVFDLFLRGSDGFRRRFATLAALAFPMARAMPKRRGLLYLNIGHTGLDEPTLVQWISRAELRAIYFIHDLIPLLHPEFCRAGEEAKHLKRMTNVLASASGLIGNSAATIADVASFAAAGELPMPPSVAAWIAGPAAPPDVQPRRFDRPHFVVVGTIEARKNHALLLYVWQRIVAELGDAAPLLVIVGQRGWEADQATALLDRAPDLEGHVIELGKSDDRELAGLIAGARALLMPSLAEGFGLPVAEALELGTPVIASHLPVFREFADDIPTYVDRLDGPAWRKTILDFVEDSPERRRQLTAMRNFVAPDWATHFQIVEGWIQTLP
jgi:glycosyltransferase involved in cell wall biosynthesis